MAQQPDLSSRSLARRITVPQDCPDIVLAVAPCRSGTTAQLRVFAENGIPAIYQPIKAVLRGEMAGEEGSRFVIPTDSDKLFIKETLGPYTEPESTINPLEVLLEAGVPSEKITTVTMMREPLGDVSSWVEQFAFGADKDALVDNAVRAYQTVDGIGRDAKERGIKTHAFVYESLRDNDAENVASRMFRDLGLPFSPDSLRDWTTLPPMGTPESHITFPPEPEKYNSVRGHLFHETVENSTGLQYYPKDKGKIDAALTPRDVAKLEAGGVFGIYDNTRRDCAREFGLPVAESGALSEFKLRHGMEERRGLPKVGGQGDGSGGFRGKER